MNPSTYGQKSTLGARDLDLHINIEDEIVKYPKYRKELINRLSGANFTKAVKSHKYEWSARDNRKLESELAVAITDSATVFVAKDPGVFNVDDAIQFVGGAVGVVESVAGGIEVTFRIVSGTQTAQDIGASVVIIGGATPQGKKADNMVINGFDDYYNLTSILEDVVDLSGTEHAAMIRGDENSGQLIARKQMELVEKLQRQLIVGVRYQDKTRKLTMMGGIKNLIDIYAPQNAIDFGGAATWSSDRTVEDKIDSALDIIADKAFDKPVMIVSPAFMKKFKYIQDDTIRTTISEKSRGLGVVKMYNSHTFGEIEVVQLQGMGHLMDDLVILVDEKQFGYKAEQGRGWFTKPLAQDGDSYRWQVLGEYTCKLDIPEAAVYLYSLGYPLPFVN